MSTAARHVERLSALVEEIFEYARLSDDAADPGQDPGPDPARAARVDLVEEVSSACWGWTGPWRRRRGRRRGWGPGRRRPRPRGTAVIQPDDNPAGP